MPRKRLGSTESRFDKIISTVRTAFRRQITKLGYDFWDEMMKNDIARSSKPSTASVKWYNENYKNNRDSWLKGGFMKPGRLYMFDYKHPKNEDTLAYWDTNPLVLSLGTFRTKAGKIRNIGINLHLLPPKVRRLVLFTIYTTFKTQYKKNLYATNPKDIPSIRWNMVKKPVEKFGVGFALRMYIPELQKHIVEFKVEDMPKAIWIPSARYAKTNPAKLEKEWKQYLKANRRIAKLVGGERHNSSV